MSDQSPNYEVKCRTCYKKFTVQLFDSHERNLFLVDKKDWYCDKCKKQYFQEQTAKLTDAQKETGFPKLEGSEKRVSWAVKIRGEMINKVNYLKSSLNIEAENEKAASDKAFDQFLQEWKTITDAKWWIDNRTMNVRDISIKIQALKKQMG